MVWTDVECAGEGFCEFGYCKEGIECYHYTPALPDAVFEAIEYVERNVLRSHFSYYKDTSCDGDKYNVSFSIYKDIDLDDLDGLNKFDLSNVIFTFFNHQRGLEIIKKF